MKTKPPSPLTDAIRQGRSGRAIAERAEVFSAGTFACNHPVTREASPASRVFQPPAGISGKLG